MSHIYVSFGQSSLFVVRNSTVEMQTSKRKEAYERKFLAKGRLYRAGTQHNPKIQLATEWRRRIESLELQISFRKRATKYRALLRKTTFLQKRH